MPYLKMLWTTESPTPQIGSWDYWCSTANTILFNCGWNCTKVNNKIAYYGMYYTSETPFGRSATPILMSPDADAVTYDTGGAVRSYSGTITDINGITWYYSGLQGFASQHPVPDCIISDEVYSSIHDAAQALLDRIYAVPFHEDYQAGQTYTLTTTNLRRTIRKAIGTYLHRNTVRYREGYAYKLLSDDADNIIELIITEITNKGSQEGLIYISIPGGALSFDIAVVHGTQGSIGQNTNQVPNATLTSQGVSYNYEHKYFRSDGYAQYSDVGAYPDWVTYVHIVTSTMSYETINAYSTQVDAIPYMAGLNLFSDMVSLTNLGIDL